MLIIEGSKDLAIHRGGVVFVGKRDFDVVTIFRVRSCSVDSCETNVIDEYRYEGETFATDILGWYPIVASLRGAAQAYYWVRLAALYVGCYFAIAGREDTSPIEPFAEKCRAALIMFFKIPSQVIIYGSLFPLVCYLMAHVIDSPMVYELIAQKFDSFNGLFQLSIMELVTISSIQMRNVWVLATVAHVVVRISTQRSWSPLQGIWGMPQFSIAMISSLTVISQFRLISLRWTPIKQIQPLGVFSRVHPLLESFLGSNYGGGGKSTLGGIFLDVKAVGCSAVVLASIATIFSLILKRVYPNSRMQLVFWRSHSFTPLSTGVLWPTSALAVSWNDDVFQLSRMESSLLHRRAPHAIVPKVDAEVQVAPPQSVPLTEMANESLANRSQTAESVYYLMNVTMLTDPVVFLSWRLFFSTTSVIVLRSATTQREYFVPLEYFSVLSWNDLTWLRTVQMNELRWTEVITCG